MSDQTKVFVYGTLKSSKQRGDIFNYCRATFIGEDKIKGDIRTLPYGFPGFIEEGDKIILGEIYNVNKETLDYLDKIEGYMTETPETSLYIRKQIKTFNNEDVMVYIWNAPFPSGSLPVNVNDDGEYYF